MLVSVIVFYGCRRMGGTGKDAGAPCPADGASPDGAEDPAAISKSRGGRAIMEIGGRCIRFFVVRTKEALIAILAGVLLIVGVTPILAADQDVRQDRILSSAEALFKTMEKRDYQRIWTYLSAKSRASIIKETYRKMAEYERGEKGTPYSESLVGQDFAQGGTIAKAYWDGYLGVFDPGLILEQSKWEMGKIDKDRAQIIIKYRKAERPAIIQMIQESGEWKVGLIETFATSKR